jgi:hypothetical protein
MAITDGNELELKISVRYKRDYSLDELPNHLLTLEAGHGRCVSPRVV